MRTAMKTAGSALAIFALVGQSFAAGSCAKQDEAMALKTAALQQELMVAALYCNDVVPYNKFVISYQRELQQSDAALLSYFQHGHGGSAAYHSYKTALANDFSLTGLHGMQAFCSAANTAFSASVNSGGERSLASFIATQSVSGAEAYPACETTMAAGGEMVTGGSTRLAANRRN